MFSPKARAFSPAVFSIVIICALVGVHCPIFDSAPYKSYPPAETASILESTPGEFTDPGSGKTLYIIEPAHESYLPGATVEFTIEGCESTPEIQIDTAQGGVVPTWTGTEAGFSATITTGVRGLHNAVLRGSCDGIEDIAMWIGFDNGLYPSDETVIKIINGFRTANPAPDLHYDWGEGILMNGLLRLAETAGDEDRASLYAYVTAFHNAHDGYNQSKFNWADPGASAWSAYYLQEAVGGDAGMENFAKVLHFVRNEEPNSAGAFNHMGNTTVFGFFAGFIGLPRQSIWVDTLAMLIGGMARYGKDTGDDDMLEFALEQPFIYAEYLRNKESGLYHHAYAQDKERMVPKQNAEWLRGNGWVMATNSEILETIGEDHPKYNAIAKLLKEHAAALIKKQMPDGLYDTVVASPGYAYPETSGTALVSYGMMKAINLGILSRAYLHNVKAAYNGLLTKLKEVDHGNYILTGISGPTNPSTAWQYKQIGQKENVHFGVGAVALLGSEITKYKASVDD